MDCSHFIKELPSIFCCRCGEIHCIICNNTCYKCLSCNEFSCDTCTITLLCGHNYCSVKCILENTNEICTSRCFFLRDLNTTGSDNYGLSNLLSHWYQYTGKNKVIEWIELSKGIEEIKEKILKLEYLL